MTSPKRTPTKVAIAIRYAGLTLPVIRHESGHDVTPLKPISDLFGLDWKTQYRKVTEGEFLPLHLGTCMGLNPHADGQAREQICIRVDRVVAYLMGINPERVRANGNDNAAKFLTDKLTEWADALHDYEELGVAVNLSHARTQEALRRQRASFAQMVGVKNKTANPADRAALAHIVQAMAGELGVPYQLDLTDAGAQPQQG